MTVALRIEDSALTDTGLVRSENEDSLYNSPQHQVWVVADGMGGHENGRFASQAIVEAVRGADVPETFDGACAAVADAVHDANQRIFAAASDAGRMMGSTVVALLIRGDEFAVLWAGDSRAYLLRDSQLIQLTSDHSQVQAMIDSGVLSEAEATDHPMRHVLSRAVGAQPGLQLDAIRDRVNRGDLFLLCSDGLHGVIDDAEIAEMLRRLGPAAARALVATCLERGAPDNVTVILVSAEEPTLLSLAGQDRAG